MGNTANLNLPYPANTDPLANMAAAIQSLANAIDTAVGGAWTAYTPTITNLTLGNGTRVARYLKKGKTLKLRIDLIGGSTSSASGAINIGLPAGMSAHASGAQALMLRHYNGSGLVIGGAVVNATGTVILPTTTAGQIAAFNNGHEITIDGEIELA